jgi:hypothetical protein
VPWEQAPSAAHLILPQARARLSANAPAAVASLTYATALAAALSRNLALTIVVLLSAAATWTVFLSNVNGALQLFLARVGTRCLSVYQMVLFGTQAAGAAIRGIAAGLVPAFLKHLEAEEGHRHLWTAWSALPPACTWASASKMVGVPMPSRRLLVTSRST